MAKRYDVKITVLSQKGICPNKHKVGDEFVVGSLTPPGMCMGAFASLLPYITTLRFGGSFPWEKIEGEGTFGCPDPEGLTVFRLKRVERNDLKE